MKEKSVCFKKWLLTAAMLFIGMGLVMAQEIRISGVVTAKEDGLPMPGVSVFVKGTTIGTITDFDGKYSLSVPQGSVMVYSFIGMTTQEIHVGAVTSINVVLQSDATDLEEVVVTALGVKREKKALGYAMQEVKGDELMQAREANLANALTGKVSGVQIIRSSNGPGGSSKIQLRGSNSITGLNQPLIVVDGVPVDNFTGADNNNYWNPSADMGNGLSDINPDDIESMSVLKGASAAALYGSRAGSGVILITTKKETRIKDLV
jgi:Outer membrane receptor for ferrienterochelin and colicins